MLRFEGRGGGGGACSAHIVNFFGFFLLRTTKRAKLAEIDDLLHVGKIEATTRQREFLLSYLGPRNLHRFGAIIKVLFALISSKTTCCLLHKR